jgi:hypothetical protein
VPTVSDTIEFKARTPDDCYRAGEKAIQEIGFTVWKTRPLAWFLIAHQQTSAGQVTANIGCRPGLSPTVRISLSGDHHSTRELQAICEEFVGAIDRALSN